MLRICDELLRKKYEHIVWMDPEVDPGDFFCKFHIEVFRGVKVRKGYYE